MRRKVVPKLWLTRLVVGAHAVLFHRKPHTEPAAGASGPPSGGPGTGRGGGPRPESSSASTAYRPREGLAETALQDVLGSLQMLSLASRKRRRPDGAGARVAPAMLSQRAAFAHGVIDGREGQVARSRFNCLAMREPEAQPDRGGAQFRSKFRQTNSQAEMMGRIFASSISWRERAVRCKG
jgi:hypothetical protein